MAEDGMEAKEGAHEAMRRTMSKLARLSLDLKWQRVGIDQVRFAVVKLIEILAEELGARLGVDLRNPGLAGGCDPGREEAIREGGAPGGPGAPAEGYGPAFDPDCEPH